MAVKKGYKQTEIGLIPEDWETKLASDVCDRIMVGIVIKPSQYYQQFGVPVFRSANIRENRIVLDDLVFISDESNKLLSKSQVKCGDVLTVRTGYPGTSAVANADHEGFNCIDILITRPSRRVDSGFFSRWVNSPFGKEQILRKQGGLAQKHFNVGDMKELLLAFPTLHEQETIAGALSDADAWIESLEQLIAKKRQIKQGAMQELLTGKRRLPGFSGKWETKRLGDLARIQRGASPRPIDSPIWFDENSKIGWVRISDVTKAVIFLNYTSQRLSPLGVQHSRPVSCGSLIMSICATVGRPIITAIETCIHDGFVVFEGLRIDQKFLYYSLAHIEGDWSRHGQTGSQMNLNTDLIKRTEIRHPFTVVEQTAIATVLSDMDTEIESLESKLSKAREIKQGMMQELLTGRIRLV